MDVALDANEFLSDPRMEGVRLKSLLNYLRKTDSGLVISKIVLDEVLARYPERISAPYRKAIDHVNAVRQLLVASKVPQVKILNLQREIKALKQKLKKPSKHVRSRILSNFSDVAVEEVAKRGVARIPPASSNGEQLRDVIIWLMILAYAKESDKEIAFISQDKHFREGDTLRPELAKDLELGNAKVHFYKSIDDFIKAHAPSPHALNEEEAFGLLTRQSALDLFEIQARRFFPRQWDAANISVLDRKVSFIKGALYDVGEGAKYGEIELSGQLHLNVETLTYFFNNAASFPGDISGYIDAYKIDPSEVVTLNTNIFSPSSTQIQFGNTPGGTSTVFSPLGNMSFDYPMQGIVNTSYPAPALRTMSSTSESMVFGKLEVSVRVVSNKLTKLEVEKFELTEIRELSAKAETM